MCNAHNHRIDCTCGFGGDGHLGVRGPSVPLVSVPLARASTPTGAWSRSTGTANFVSPNATCPVCGAPVYYYQNEHGSRVYFDELGPPWSKHPCMDIPLPQVPSNIRRGQFVTPSARSTEERRALRQSNPNAAANPKGADQAARPASWQQAIILARTEVLHSIHLELEFLSAKGGTVFATCGSLPRCCKAGFVVSYRPGRISFVDTSTMRPVEIKLDSCREAPPREP